MWLLVCVCVSFSLLEEFTAFQENLHEYFSIGRHFTATPISHCNGAWLTRESVTVLQQFSLLLKDPKAMHQNSPPKKYKLF
jgi:hypothetical protein